MSVDRVQVTPEQWREAVADARSDGYVFLHGLDGVDDLGRGATITVTCRLLRFDPAGRAPDAREVRCSVPRDEGRLASVRDLFTGAAWYEREVRDFFGVQFMGAEHDAPLLQHNPELRPLRKDFVLASRVAAPWPGGKEPGESARDGAPSRRRLAPPGVPDPSVWGDRSPGQPAPDADELAASLAGGRVRRRR